MTNHGLTVFNGFFLAAFEAGGNRPQPQGLRTSISRKALMLGVKTGGVPLGFKRGKRFLWFLSYKLFDYSWMSFTAK